ncbi:MAG TPA: patatin-like phospholipase family protein, partial [Bryobacterales bacterium]|nr:patatin-like phospholipase family protein [Bryobacterales bacterium]
MKLVQLLIVWVRRLPWRFTVLLVLLMSVYLAIVSALVSAGKVPTIAAALAKLLEWLSVPASLLSFPPVIIALEGIAVVLLLLFGVLASYNLAAWLYPMLRPKPGPLAAAGSAPPASETGLAPATTPLSGHPLDGFGRIGIILAGGGAKGAYQAGAMKAIYEFLEQNSALDRVKMIAGTSIGSWNSLFWLAGMVQPQPGGASAHERWWRSISVAGLVEFDTYWPLRDNHFLRSTPWQENFNQLFLPNKANSPPLAALFGPDPPMHFYFTRSNVELGRLEFSTNWPGIWGVQSHYQAAGGTPKMLVHSGCCEVIQGDVAAALAHTRRAVFASMDIPPLFPFIPIKLDAEEWFEDGGVVDNLPVWFGTEIEKCDLLFVLPLNASYAEPVNQTSVLHRVARVIDVRQGVIERNAFKLAYLYNELAASKAPGRDHKLV